MTLNKRILLTLCAALLLVGCAPSGNPALYKKTMTDLNGRIVQQSKYLEEHRNESADNLKLIEEYAQVAKEKGRPQKVEFTKDDPRLKDLMPKDHESPAMPQESLESLNDSQRADVENTIKVNSTLDNDVAVNDLVRAQNAWYRQEIEKLKAAKPAKPQPKAK